MIEVTVSSAKLVVGEESELTIHLTNTGSGTCTQIIFTLTLPTGIMLLGGRNKIELRRLAPGETVTRPFRVLPRSAGACQVTSPDHSRGLEAGD